jgi:hypothetical protein
MDKLFNILCILGVFALAGGWCLSQATNCEERAQIARDSYKQGMLYKQVTKYKIAASVIMAAGCLISALIILS